MASASALQMNMMFKRAGNKVKAPAPAPVSSSGSELPAIFLKGFPEGGIDAAAAGKTAPVSSFAGGLVGADVEAGEFDPLELSAGLSDETLQWYRAAELKHGRVCMLASLGILTAAAVPLPDPVFQSSGALSGLYKLYTERPEAIWQILTAIAAIEVSALFFGPQDAEAGDYGWDPLNFQEKYGLNGDQEAFNLMRLKELKNGRLAMLMTLGLLSQEAISGKGVYEMFQ